MAQIVPYRQDVGARAVSGEKQRAVQDGFGQDVGAAAGRVGQQAAQLANVWERQRIAQDEASALELDTGFAEEARKLETGFLAMSGRNAVDAAERVRTQYDDLEARYRGMAQNERQRGMLTRVLGQRRARFDGAASTHLVRETDVYRTTAAEARIASLSTDLVSMPDGPGRLAGMQAIRNEIDAEAARKGLDAEVAEVTFLSTISGVHEATIGALVEAGDPTVARDYIDRWAPQIDPGKLTRLREAVRKEVDTFEAVTFWDAAPARPAPTVTAEVEGQPVTVTLRPPVAAPAGSGFGPRRSPGGVGSSNHRGVDYPVAVNTPVTASAPGVVRWKDDPDGYGRYAVVDHGNGVETVYAHLGRASVAEGARVEQGDVIGMSGGARGAPGSGNSQGPHVHYEVRQNGSAINPERALRGSVTVAPGAGRSVSEALPETLEDVYEQADAAAGGDWRRREVFRAEGVRRFNQGRAIRSDAESEAERQLQEYLPGGAKEVSSLNDIPRSIRDGVSPGALRGASVAIENEQKGESAIDPVLSDDLYNYYANEAARDPAAFLARGDFTTERQRMGRDRVNSLRAMRRELLNGGPDAEDALKGMNDVILEYAQQAGLITGDSANRTARDSVEEARLRAGLDNSVRRYRETHNGQNPDRQTVVGFLNLLVREVEADTDGDGRSGRLRAFQAGSAAVEEVMTGQQRTAAVQALRRQFPNTRDFTDAQIAAMHRRLVFGTAP
jgi:hypothetical protein